jgi:aminomuconate-semialdehyde/2-hydroxymuconate-6-semialdehyde dehydrogenase
MEQIKNYIGGEFVAPESEKYFDNFEPATGHSYSKIPDSDARDVQKAVRAAEQAFKNWSRTPPHVRADFLKKISAKILSQLEPLSQAESKDTGKPISLARSLDIPRSAQNFSFFADAIVNFKSELFRNDNSLNFTELTPLGVVSCISPWNLPLYLISWKIAPALAAGNCVIAKPSEVTPMTAYLLSKICADIGLPAGVLNIVHGIGSKLGPELVQNKSIRAISFTGSTSVGREIAKLSAPLFKKTSLEMGGKNPNIIFADCDFDEAVRTSVRAAFLNQGQICLCGSRILVEKSIYEKFRIRFLAETLKLKQGDPLLDETDQGALVSQAHFQKVLHCIEMAKLEGAKILCGGEALHHKGRIEKGWFIAPTILEGLRPESKTNQEEIFGPVVSLQSFETEDEALHLANASRYGLAACVWTQSSTRAKRFAQHLESGIVWVNCWLLRDLRTAFGGVKESGVGREGGEYALKFFSETKNICYKI